MTLITGSRQWTLVIRGNVPPGAGEQELAASLLASVTVPLHIIPHLRETEVKFSDAGLPDAGKKLV